MGVQIDKYRQVAVLAAGSFIEGLALGATEAWADTAWKVFPWGRLIPPEDLDEDSIWSY
jgi:hypothetical protein